MQKSNSRAHLPKQVRCAKPTGNASKNKKQVKQSSSKNLKLLKSPPSRQQHHAEEHKVKQETSPPSTNRTLLDNDYGVNTFYAKYKVKTSKKKEFQDQYQSTDYGNFNNSRDADHITQFETRPQKKATEKEEGDYASNAFQKFKLPNQRGLINAEGKFVSSKKETGSRNYSFKESSTSKNSFSLNFTSREGSRRKLNKSKSKKLQSNKSLDQKARWRGGEKSEAHSYYEKRKSYSKKKKQTQPKEIAKILEINSKGTTEIELQSSLKAVNFIANDDFMLEVKAEITKEMEASRGTIRKQRLSQAQLRERTRCVQLLGRLCGALSMKRESFFLAVFYMDQYLSQFPVTSLKIVALGALTLGLKMDDAEMTSKFCFQYLYNPEKTVKRNSSGAQLRLKQKQKEQKEPTDDPRELKGKLSSILSSRISQEKRGGKEELTLDEILDFETQMMVRLGFKLVTKTVNYWTDIFTALWDSFVNEYRPDFMGTLQFRSETQGRNWSYLLQLLEGQFATMAVYSLSRISLVLGGLYLVARVALQERREETPWEELCRYYRASLAKSSNLVFCDGVGINPLFGDFLALFDLSLANIVDAIQALSRHLLPETIRVHDYHRVEGGKTREDRLSTYIYNEELYRAAL